VDEKIHIFFTYLFIKIENRWLEIISLWVNESFASLRTALRSYAANTWQCLLEVKFHKRASAFVLKSMFRESKRLFFFFSPKERRIFKRTKLKISIKNIITIHAMTLNLEK